MVCETRSLNGVFLELSHQRDIQPIPGKRFKLKLVLLNSQGHSQFPLSKHGPWIWGKTLQWNHNEHDGVSNHQRLDCLLNRLFMRRSKKTSKLRVSGLYEGNSLVTGEFLAQSVSNAGNVSIWWRHYKIHHWSRESLVSVPLRLTPWES